MKNLLIVFSLFFICVQGCGQSKTSGGSLQPFTAKDIAHSDSLALLSDSVTVLRTDWDALNTRVTALEPSTGIYDTIAPWLLSGSANSAGVVDLTFSETIISSRLDSISKGLAIEANTVDVPLDSVNINPGTNLIKCFIPDVISTDVLTVSYIPPVDFGIRDSSDNDAIAWTDSSVTNNVVSYYDFTAYYKFENNTDDEEGDYDGTLVGNTTFTGANAKCGSYSATFDNTGDAFNCGAVNTGGEFSIAGWFNLSEDGDEYLVANRSQGTGTGWDLSANTNEQLTFQMADGASTSFAYAPNGMVWDTWTFIVLTVSKTSDRIYFYKNGVDVTLDSIVSNLNFATSGQNLYIGNVADLSNSVDGEIDEFKIFDKVLTQEEITFLYQNACTEYYYPPDPDPVPDDTTDFTSYADSIFAWDAQSNSTGKYLEADLAADMSLVYDEGRSGFGYYNNPKDTTVYIAEDGTNKYMHIIYHDNEVGIITDDEGGAGGVNGSGCLHHPTFAGQEEVYLSINYYLKAGWDAQAGGKFCGIFAGTRAPSGYADIPDIWDSYDGFSASLAFEGRWEDDPVLFMYIYEVDMTGKYGATRHISDPDNLGSNWTIPTGEWWNFTYRVVMNTVMTEGNGNGFIEFFINGKYAGRNDNLRLRRDPATKIDKIILYFTFGGDNLDQASEAEEYLNVDDIYLFKYLDLNNEPIGFDKSSEDRTLTLPNWSTSGGEPIHTNQ